MVDVENSIETIAAHSQKADIVTSSDDYAKRFSGKTGRYFLDVQKNVTLGLLKKFTAPSILDVGGGHAQLAEPMVNNGFNVTIAGSSEECRRRPDALIPKDSFNFVVADLLHLPFPDRYFDVTIAFRLLTHEENWQLQLGELCRTAGKAVILDYPDRQSFNSFYNLFFNLKKKLEGDTRTFRTFSKKQIKDEFRRNGFRFFFFKPQFFFPMFIHRMINHSGFSSLVEKMARIFGLTRLFGSPVIIMACRVNE